MNTSKIRDFLKNPEHVLLLLTSILSTVTSVFFVGREVQQADIFFLFSFEIIYLFYGFTLLLLLATLFYIFRKPVDFFSLSGKLILVFLPTAFLWFYGFSKSIHFHLLFRLANDFYLIFTCFYLLFKYKKYRNISDFLKDLKENKNEKTENNLKDKVPGISRIPLLRAIGRWIRCQGIVAALVLSSVLIINLGFGLSHLSEFAAVDEPLWTHGRITKFWNNVLDGEWKKTTISDKPGITVALLSGVGLIRENPDDYKNPSWEGENMSDYKDIRGFNFAMRFPIFIFNTLMLLVFYALLARLLGKPTALLSVILIGLSPLLLGISSIINPDSLLWVFMPLSLISYFIYLKDSENKYLYLSGLFLGLAILTKYIANFLYIFYFGMIFLEYIINNEKYRTIGISKYFKKAIGDYVIIISFSLLTYFALLPAAWLDISVIFDGTLLSKAFTKVWPLFLGIIALVMLDIKLMRNKLTAPILNFLARFKTTIIKTVFSVFLTAILATIINTYSGMKFFDFESILASPKSSFAFAGFAGLMLANFYSLIFGIIPVALLAIIFLSLKNVIRNSSSKKPNETALWSFYIIVFILLYYLASTINNVSATVRYQIIIYPLALILSAIGIYEFIRIEKIKKYFKENFALLILLIFSVYSLNFIKPFYFSYASGLLPEQYVLNLKDMGDGSYEAAQFLNKLPDAKKLYVWTDKRGVCAFFIGRCSSGFDFATTKVKFDYFVVSAGRETRTTKMILSRFNGGNTEILRVDKLYSEEEYVYKLEIGKRPNNFVKIISLDQLLD